MKLQNQILYILFFLCSTITFAQQEISNKVLDFFKDEPIESASVYIKTTAIGTITNADGKFALRIPRENATDTLVVSSIGYSTEKIPLDQFDASEPIYLVEEVASLDEVVLEAEERPKTGNEIVLKAIEKLPLTMPDSSYIQKGFLRHKERNKKEFKWLIESAISVYDSSYNVSANTHLKINVDQMRKSYDLRDIDSLFTYASYLNQNNKTRTNPKNLRRVQIKTAELNKAIKWNDNRVNGLQNIFQGKLNMFRNVNSKKALFGDDILKKHQFELDTILVDNERKLYKIKINKGAEYVGLDTKGIYNEGYHANGWLYIYYDNFAIKKVEYELIAASNEQKSRSKRLFDTQVNHKLVINYKEFNDKMYPNYIYYETPKLVNVGFKPKNKQEEELAEQYKEERYYYTIQEILFSDIVLDPAKISSALQNNWDMDIFSPKPYNKEFWKTYNVLLESEDDEKLIDDLSQRASLFKE
ncbi:carboxypeptidase-like regulatory domain-containing protein [Lacinutrix sp.]|uniref:carboxypeptidase-like regulatory domain-containing protein n=2 Tax=Lacinutrix sp. TaxID=1937692 RepID=UPI0026195B4C|nr:carboxypeptidase-like regulatory domain-containing protein [Lacinutrix sp.]MDG1714086.1 carboxypeptidase-like regulatory domain-containing protein [Lacinutrix sp.]